jgi:hypothetical protein
MHRSSTDITKFFLCLALLLGIAFFSGCQSDRLKHEPDVLSFVPTNYTHNVVYPETLRRVAVLPVWFDAERPESVSEYQEALVAQLAERGLFEVVRITSDMIEARYHRKQFASWEMLPTDFQDWIQSIWGADAVLFTDVSRFDPYMPLQVSFRTKLLSTQSVSLIWSFDHHFDSGDPSIAMGAKRYSRGQFHRAYPLDKTTAITISPFRFWQYILSTAFSTLPSRETKVPTSTL